MDKDFYDKCPIRPTQQFILAQIRKEEEKKRKQSEKKQGENHG